MFRAELLPVDPNRIAINGLGLGAPSDYREAGDVAVPVPSAPSALPLSAGEGHEVAPSDLGDAIDKAFESRPVGDGQVTLEDDAVKTREHGDDQLVKLESTQGVCLRS